MKTSYDYIDELNSSYKLSKIRGNYVVVNRRNPNTIETNVDFVSDVMFVAAWKKACTASKRALAASTAKDIEDSSKLSEKRIYEVMMRVERAALITRGDIVDLSTVIIALNKALDNYFFGPSIMSVLYSTEEYRNALRSWVKHSIDIPFDCGFNGIDQINSGTKKL